MKRQKGQQQNKKTKARYLFFLKKKDKGATFLEDEEVKLKEFFENTTEEIKQLLKIF